MKIIVADKISSAGVNYFKAQKGFEVVEAYGLYKESLDKFLDCIQDADAIALRSESKVTAEVLAAAPKLKVVGRAGVGTDNIDKEAATERGVIVMNTPGGNTIATAELTFTHMLCGARPVAQANASMKAGKWGRKDFPGSELFKKTLGICALGRIGTEVAKRAQAFGMTVLAYDPFLTDSRAESLGVEKVDLDTVFERSDYITVHTPLTDETRNMVNAEAFAKMKDGVRLFNCARGGIINEEDLVAALKSGKVAAAGLDVYVDEPLAEDSPLRQVDNLVLTPHLGASTVEAQESVGIEIAEQMVDALTGGQVRNALNMPSVDPKVLELLKPYLELGEKLGTFIQQLSSGCVEQLKVTYFGKITELDTLPLGRAIQRGYLKHITPDVNDVNAPQKLQQLGVAVETVKSNSEKNYTELIEVQTVESDGKTRNVAGTLIGKAGRPRIVEIDGHGVEVNTRGTLLVLKNKDVPGIVGFLGTALGEDAINIANMSLSRDQGLGYAISVYELDSVPSDSTQTKITENDAIEKFRVIQL